MCPVAESWPPCSIVVPTRDRPGALRACLEGIGALEYAGEVEVIVADDGTEPVDAALDAVGRLEVEVVRIGGAGPAVARNAGAARARGELVAFTDDDCAPDRGWLAALAARHAAQPGAAVGGRTINALPRNLNASAAQLIVDCVYDHYDADPARARFLASNNLLVPAARFGELSGFDESIGRPGGEDRDLCERWLERGWPMAWEPKATIRHAHTLSLGGFVSQQFAYGRGAFVHRRGRMRRGGGLRLEPSLRSGIFAAAAGRAVRSRRPGQFGLIVAWQAANLAGFATEAVASPLRRRRPAGSAR
jgi:glycosyltransferase involved in cell wall biosynthesis